MYKHILIATDGSELAGKAVAQGLELAKAIGARTTVIMVTEPWATMAPPQVLVLPMVQDYEKALAAHAEKILSAAEEAAKETDVVCSTKHVRDQLPAEGILEAANTLVCDLIVMASHGRRGLSKMLLGSVAAEVLTLSSISVLICR